MSQFKHRPAMLGLLPPRCNPELVQMYVRKSLLVIITEYDERGDVVESLRAHGMLHDADANGITLQLSPGDGNRIISLPVGLESIKVAVRGTYELRATGEVIRDPDLILRVERRAAPSTQLP